MVNAERISQDITNTISKNGDIIKLTYYTSSISGADYNNEYLTGSTTIWGKGLVQPLNKADSAYLEQGKLDLKDKKMYVAGSISIEPNMEIQVGSPTGEIYKLVEKGNIPFPIGSGGDIGYNKVYITRLIGSYWGRY
jgi:hypothetical protein